MRNEGMKESITIKNQKRVYDLEPRTTKFAVEVVKLCKKTYKYDLFRSLTNQLIRSATSIGANYCEADDAHTKKEFLQKISFCRKESRESNFWLKVIMEVLPKYKEEADRLHKESNELNLIFSAIIRNSRKN